MAFLAFRNQDGVLKLFESNESTFINGYATAFARDFARKYSRVVRQRCSRARAFKKNAVIPSLKKCYRPAPDRSRILLSTLFFDGSKRCRKRPLLVLFCENDRFSRDLLNTVQALKFRLTPKSAHLFYLICCHTWQ
jgi:hypothetical protein